MSRHKRQDNRGWIDDGPRRVDSGSVAWPARAFGPGPAARAHGRDIEDGGYYGLGPDSLAAHGGQAVRGG